MNQISLLLCFLLALLPLPFKAQLGGTLQCQSGCSTCSSPEVCSECDSAWALQDGKCRCEPPRILISNNCECPWYMSENSDTQVCEYIDLIDVAYQSMVSPLFDAVFQVQMNPRLKWTASPTFIWTVDCNYQNTATQGALTDYLSDQQSDLLVIPFSFLEYNFQCDVKVSYFNQNSVEVSKEFSFKTTISTQPQVQIVGGPFQMLRHSEVNMILAEVQSPSSAPKIAWTQLSGDTIDMSQLQDSSNSERLTIPKCTLSPGKIYSFKVSVQYGTNPLSTTQTVTIGVYSPKISLQSIETDSYHISTGDLTLTASQFSVQDECDQELIPAQFFDMLNLQYNWECMVVDISGTRRLALESTVITGDPNVLIHPDPQNIFYSSITSETLTIPSSYFTSNIGSQFIFYLTATVPSKNPTPSIKDFNLIRPTLNVIQTKAYVQILASKPFTDLTFSCRNTNGCQAFSDDTTKFIGLNYDPELTYTWIVNANSVSVTSLSYNNWLTLSTNPNPNIVPQIILQVTDGTNTASAFFTLPTKTPIQTGSLYINPSSGDSYNTNFFISTSLNQDDDLPISYQFFTSCSPGRNLMIKKYEPLDYSTIILPPGRGKCSIGVQMTDNLGSMVELMKSMTLTGRSASLSESLVKDKAAMDASKDSTNIYQRLRLISVILENLQSWESADPDVTLNATSAEFKYSVMSEMKDIFLALSPRDDIKFIMLNNLLYASNQQFNQDKNWNLYFNILDDYYQTNSETSIMDYSLTQTFAMILDNLIYYMKKPGNKIQDPEKILTYVNNLARSSIYNAIPTKNADYDGFFFGGTFFSISAKKTTYCQALTPLPVAFYYGMEFKFIVKPGKTISPDNCNKEADAVFMAFRPNYTVPDEDVFGSQTLLFVDLRDSATGKSLLDTFDFSLYSYVEFCPNGPVTCVNDDSGATTITGSLDLRDQIYRTFGKVYVPPSNPGNNPPGTSNPTVSGSVEEENFEILKSTAFWAAVAVSVWSLVTFCYFKNSTYCALKGNKYIAKKPLFKKTSLLFWLTHPLMGIFFYNDPKMTKATRIAIYYQRLIVVMMFSAIFSLISEREEAVVRAYIILFNILTALPANSALSRIFGWAFKRRPSKKKNMKNAFGILFYFLCLAACFAYIFIIDSHQDESSWNKDWGIDFAISFGQDLLLSHFISLTLKVLLFKCSPKNILLQNFKPIYTSIFGINLPPIETQAPTPTEIASPMSTDRKLLKLPNIDTGSPTLPTSSPTKCAFRKRRVSDTEMANVDSVAAENLATDRFQTLFGEGKTERIRENSPVKENYERMQSANVSSAKFSSSSRLVSPRDFNLNGSRKFVNIASLMLTPSSPLSQSRIEIGPEENNFSPVGSPREDSSPKLLKDSLTSSKEKAKNQSERCQTLT